MTVVDDFVTFTHHSAEVTAGYCAFWTGPEHRMELARSTGASVNVCGRQSPPSYCFMTAVEVTRVIPEAVSDVSC